MRHTCVCHVCAEMPDMFCFELRHILCQVVQSHMSLSGVPYIMCTHFQPLCVCVYNLGHGGPRGRRREFQGTNPSAPELFPSCLSPTNDLNRLRRDFRLFRLFLSADADGHENPACLECRTRILWMRAEMRRDPEYISIDVMTCARDACVVPLVSADVIALLGDDEQ